MGNDLQEGILSAVILDGKGGCRRVSKDELFQNQPQGQLLWVHLNYDTNESSAWLQMQDLPSWVREALSNPDIAPRLVHYDDGVLLCARAANLGIGQPGDFIGLRVWLGKDLLITSRRRPLKGVSHVIDTLHAGDGPHSLSGCVVSIIGNMLESIEKLIDRMELDMDDIEKQMRADHLQRDKNGKLMSKKPRIMLYRNQISQLRRLNGKLKRFLLPQREAVRRLNSFDLVFFERASKMALGESEHHLDRLLDDLQGIHERLQIVGDEIDNMATEELNRRTFTLSLIAFVFMPLTFLTGLLGVNVEGIPFANHPYSFVVLVMMLVSMGAGLYFWFKKRGWM